MSREIKFRTWDGYAKRMAVQGTPYLETLSFFISHYGDNDLMQYTGLKDMNGLEIFEGDLVTLPFKSSGGMVLEVIYESREASFECVNVLDRSVRRFFNNPLTASTVIGNIYENKELLNGEDK